MTRVRRMTKELGPAESRKHLKAFLTLYLGFRQKTHAEGMLEVLSQSKKNGTDCNRVMLSTQICNGTFFCPALIDPVGAHIGKHLK